MRSGEHQGVLETAMLKFGFGLRDFVGEGSLPTPLYRQIEDAAELVRIMDHLGAYDVACAQHHWLSHPTIWLEPIPLLARLAPDAGHMQLMTSVMKPPIHNPVDLAHEVATLDQICNGRLIFGIGGGYTESEFEAAGATKAQRALRLEECVNLMKALWSGDVVSFEGRYWAVHDARMGYTPVQRPHPPIWIGSYSMAATRRAARISDGILIARQATWKSVAQHADEYRRTLREFGKSTGMVGVNRNISVAPTYESAQAATRARVTQAASYYSAWGVQESSTIDTVLDAERDPRDWSIVGTPTDCVETICRYREEIGIDFIAFGFANLPKEHSARKEYVQYVAEEVLNKVR
jgi:alkanesulfonate monooxygenase SsuD/methylene tetrahydromethanopterin reductase-like flavin-dependent oxidoreductase (luciferase family)